MLQGAFSPVNRKNITDDLRRFIALPVLSHDHELVWAHEGKGSKTACVPGVSFHQIQPESDIRAG